MKALSIRQPWAWLIANGHKPYENRTWNTKHRGAILFHASKALDRLGYAWVSANFPKIVMPLPQDFERGGIVGQAELLDVETGRPSPWCTGPFGFHLARAKPLPFVPMPGRLGFFDVALPLQSEAA